MDSEASGAEWKPKPRGGVDPSAILAQLEADDPAAAVSMPRGEAYCSFCWSAMRPDAEECESCGGTVKQMDAARKAAEERDRSWVPQRVASAAVEATPGGPEPPARVEVPEVPPAGVAEAEVPPPSPRVSRPLRVPAINPSAGRLGRNALIAGGTIVYLAASIVVGTWLSYAMFPDETPTSGTSSARVAKAEFNPARVRLTSPDPQVVVELVNTNGLTLGGSDEKTAVSGLQVRAGEYRLRVSDRDGRWRAPETPVTIEPGERRTLSPDPEVLQLYRGR